MNSRRFVAVLVAGCSVVAVGLLGPAGAQGRPTPEPSQDIAARLGASRTGGGYLDDSGRMVVTVTVALAKSVSLPGTAWGTDPIGNQVVVTLDNRMNGAQLAKVKAVTDEYGDVVRVERTSGRFTAAISGGRYIQAREGTECSLGFNVRDKSNNTALSFLSAGHCTRGTTDWYDAGSTRIGYLHNGSVQDISHSRDPFANEAITKSGWWTGVTTGRVQQFNVTVNYGDGAVNGLFRTSACVNRGDSGGPEFHGDAALGLVPGFIDGASPCVSYHQPVNEALAWYGQEVY